MEIIEKKHCKCSSNPMKKIVFSIMLITAGILWLLFNLNILPEQYSHLVFSWKSILIAIGIIGLFGKEGKITGLILIIIGGTFLLPNIFSFNFEYHKVIWPLLLIIIGITLLFKRIFVVSAVYKENLHTLESGVIKETNVFSGMKRKIYEKQFRGGEIINVFGGSEIDLRGCELAEGNNILDITCVFGGIVLIVPAHWVVVPDFDNVMGSFNDKRIINNINTDNTRKLIVKGTAVFGGGELKTE